MTYVGRGKKMREKIGSTVLRSFKNFEGDFERGSFEFRSQNHTVKMTGEQPERRGLGSGLPSNYIETIFWLRFFLFLLYTLYF